jgi:D-alanyl-D-alanine carboxypeptidase
MTDAVLAVKSPSCGRRILTSGPSKLDATELHRIGSVTKTYVAAVVLRLAKEGTLSLNDKLSKYVTGVANGDQITVRQLLNHTSGVFNYTEDPAFMDDVVAGKTMTPKMLLDTAAKHEPYFKPGAGWHYSNTNFVLLGLIAEQTGQAKIGELVRKRVFEKAGLKQTYFDGEEPVQGILAVGRSAKGKDVSYIGDPSWAWAAGAMTATPGDVVSWIEQLGNGTFHDADTQRELMTTVKTTDKSFGCGLGIFSAALAKSVPAAFGHGGDIMGYHTTAYYVPEKRTTIVAIVDSDTENPNDVSAVALRVLFGETK